ncbi:WXG100 family type VII secretion target [Glaciihabitans arcticus]|uniref:ESAT-6-like protein n=1 Tax=Glaciihabitans arcticus TaxID=2668039 RepID=A0A4Q9GRL6_9MICO|nr:WXG100 family type VII secretion target [Glaciihabitans arcticus]TBN57596.1 WXG100 family type VII secretion target [Glaciihabitans arcticus]
MTRYQVDSEAVLTSSSSVHAAIGRIRAEVAGLTGQLTALEQQWNGPAAAAFQAGVAEWRGTQQRVEENLGAIGSALGHAGQGYADVEATNARLFGR